MMRFGVLEAGGTKMVCAIGKENGEILERISIPTETPDIPSWHGETMIFWDIFETI